MKTEPSEKGNAHLAARRAKKAALLPRAAELAGEGRTYQEIADALGIAKSTVCQWLRDRTLGRAAAKALGTPRMTAKLAARYESLYQRALREWNRSKADRRTQTVVTSEPAEGGPTTTTTVRTEPQKRNAACLGKAVAAMKAMEGLHWRELSRQDWLENLQRDAAADKNEDGLTRTVKTTMTRSGRKLRTVVTRRSDAGRLAAHRDELKDADEMRRALEARLDAGGENIRAAIRAEKELQAIEARMDVAEEAADEEARAALKAEAAAAEEKLQAAEARLGANEHAAPACPPAIAADEKAGEKGAEAAGRAQPVPISRKENGDADTGSARLANSTPAKRPIDWRKSFVQNDLRLRPDDFASDSRSAKLPNEVFQKGGPAKEQNRAKRDRRKARRRAARESGPRRGSAATLTKEG